MTGFGHYDWVWIVALAALLGFGLYRRGRRLIGRQRFAERRTQFRIVVLAAVIAGLEYAYMQRGNPQIVLLSTGAGVAAGVLVALAALRFTQMGRDEKGVWYVPNLYLGLGLIVLLVARYAYDYVVVFPEIRKQAELAAAYGARSPVVQQPMLHGILFLVLGYYLVYYVGILLRAHRLQTGAPTDMEGGA